MPINHNGHTVNIQGDKEPNGYLEAANIMELFDTTDALKAALELTLKGEGTSGVLPAFGSDGKSIVNTGVKWDNANKRVGVNVTPVKALHVHELSGESSILISNGVLGSEAGLLFGVDSQGYSFIRHSYPAIEFRTKDLTGEWAYIRFDGNGIQLGNKDHVEDSEINVNAPLCFGDPWEDGSFKLEFDNVNKILSLKQYEGGSWVEKQAWGNL